MTRLGLRGRMVAAVAAVGALLAAVLVVLVLSVFAYRQAVDSIRTSERSIGRATQLEKLVLDLETGQRGFVITGDEAFLEPWEAAREQLPALAAAFVSREGDADDEPAAQRIGDRALEYLRVYSLPLVAQARADRDAAAGTVASASGKRRVDELRRLVDAFVAAEGMEADERRSRADRLGSVALAVGVAGLLAVGVLIVLLYGYLNRAVVQPVGRLARATGRLAAGELSARVPESGPRDEVGALASSFNAMAGSLERARDEHESQNAELEAQQLELANALGELGLERDRVVALNRFARRLTAEAEVETLALAALDALCEVAGAEVGAVYAAGLSRWQGLRLVSSRGVHPDRLDPVLVPGDGPAARAVAERAPVEAAGGEAGRHELHLPLVQGDRVLGVVSLERAGPGFAPADRAMLENMAAQVAVALSNAIALRRARREASITRAVLDATPDGICLTDLNGDILLANAPMVDLTFNVLELPVEGTVYEKLLAAADQMVDPEAYRAGMTEIAEHPEGQFRQEYTVTETNRSFLGYVAPVLDATGTLGGRVFVLRETTAERQAERLKDELVATVSHELRTPLTSIIGYLELVLSDEEGELADEQRRFLEVVDRNARRLLDVVGDLLFVAQVEAGRLILELEPLELAVLAGEAADSARPLAASKEIEIVVDAAAGLAANGDRLRLAQLLANLVSNAVKFTPEGGRVEIRARPVAGNAVLEVRDTGIGIPEEEQERLFQRFFRSSTAAQHAIQGTGLGLVICKTIAEAHGGSIGFTSVAGEGTTFRVELPLAARAGQEVGAA